MLISVLSVLNFIAFMTVVLFAYESWREREIRPCKIGLAGVGFHFLLGLAILFFPEIRTPVAWFFGTFLAGLALLLIPPRKNARSLKGAAGYLAKDGSGFLPVDERDITFARNRCLIRGSEQYEAYYRMHPERKEHDDRRREKGAPWADPGPLTKATVPMCPCWYPPSNCPTWWDTGPG